MRQSDLLTYPTHHTADPRVNRAYRIALGDLAGNDQTFQDDLLETPAGFRKIMFKDTTFPFAGLAGQRKLPE